MQCRVEGGVDLIALEFSPDRNRRAPIGLQDPTHLPQCRCSVWEELKTLLT